MSQPQLNGHSILPAQRRPRLAPRDTLDATHLTGSLRRDDGTAELRPSLSSANPHATLTAASAGSGQEAGLSDASDSALWDDDSPIENYDDLEIDPDTLVVNARASGVDDDDDDNAYRPRLASSMASSEAEPAGQNGSASSASHSRHQKNNSIPIKLERTGKKGRYVLTADDPEIKEILRKGIEKQEAEAGRGKKPRIRFRDLVFTRQFTTFDRQNPATAQSPFFGFFTLFWICMILIFVQLAMRNRRDYGSFLGDNQLMKLMFGRDVLILGLTDGVICAACFEGWIFQLLVSKGYIDWAKHGWIIQNLWQTAYVAAFIWWSYFREWPWTHTIFIALHGIVFLMKQHSYAFYNGYLSSVAKRRTLLERKLKQLEAIEPIASPPTSPGTGRASFQLDSLSTGTDLRDAGQSHRSLGARRLSKGPVTSTNLAVETSDVAEIAAAIESGQPIDQEQLTVFASIIRDEIDDLSKELHGKSKGGHKAYPHNLTLGNLAEFICLPTVVYELEYPRQERINWWYVLEKTVATFGVLCIMQVVSQGYIYPLVVKTMQMKEAGMSLDERWQEFPYIVSDMLFPLLIEQLLTWYLIWECILNVLAELTRFADRGFYGDWWNSVTWDQYARDWNRPVHNFLLRHVYHSSISSFHLSRTSATFVTFLLSALVHEMVMVLLFKKVRGYLFWSQLCQLPLAALSRSKWIKGNVIFGNTLFWLGLFIGPSFLTCLYLVV